MDYGDNENEVYFISNNIRNQRTILIVSERKHLADLLKCYKS